MCSKPLPTVRCRTIGSCGINNRFQLVSRTQGQVAHALLTRPPLIPPKGSPFDLNVLCTPPALILSQDQTLEIMVSKRLGEESIKSISSLIAHLLFFRVCISLSELSRCSAQSTHISRCVLCFILISYCSIFKDRSATSISRGDLFIIPHQFALVNRFLKLFSKNFFDFDLAAVLYHRFFAAVAYYITFTFLCQPLFFNFFEVFCIIFRHSHR